MCNIYLVCVRFFQTSRLFNLTVLHTKGIYALNIQQFDIQLAPKRSPFCDVIKQGCEFGSIFGSPTGVFPQVQVGKNCILFLFLKPVDDVESNIFCSLHAYSSICRHEIYQLQQFSMNGNFKIQGRICTVPHAKKFHRQQHFQSPFFNFQQQYLHKCQYLMLDCNGIYGYLQHIE